MTNRINKMSKKLTEYRFEEWVEQSLHKHGYTSRLYTEYDKDLCLIVEDVIGFIKDTQQEEYNKLFAQFDVSTDANLCKTINNAIASRGIVEVLRNGISTRGCSFELVYFEPRSGLNKDHQNLYTKNRFVTVRQLHYSKKNNNSIDMVLFLNGIPIVTMELKNQLTGQNLKNSEYQYKNDRDPKEPLLNFQRCFVHFCIDNDVASMSSQLNGAKTKFFPYNKGISNPIVEGDYRTEYVWNEIFNAVAPFHPYRKEYYTQKALDLNLSLPEFVEDKESVGKIIACDKVEKRLGYKFINNLS